ncbi:MAG: hemolysin family protein [Acidobacteriota bacterium]
MSIWDALALAAPALLLLLTATLEVAFRSTSRLDLRRWAQHGRAGDDEARLPGDDVGVALTAVRLARQLSLLTLAVVVTWIGSRRAPEWGVAWLLGLALFLYVVIDKLLAFAIVAVVGPLRLLVYGRPLTALLRKVLGQLADRLYRFHRGSRSRREPEPERSEDGDLDAFLDMAEEEGLVSKKDEALLRGVADFGEAVVDEVMTPRVDIISIDADAALNDLRRLVADHKLSRIPVVKENIDEVVGVVHIKDLVSALGDSGGGASIVEITRPALFVPETKKVRDLLREFQQRRAHMAIVVDEYGGTAGLVTLEDLLEEIVGEIQDEYEDVEKTVVKEAEGIIIAAGKAEVEEVELALGVKISDEEFETVGGMAFAHLGYVPRPGEVFDCDGLHVEVLEADDRRVQRVRITRQ